MFLGKYWLVLLLRFNRWVVLHVLGLILARFVNTDMTEVICVSGVILVGFVVMLLG